MNRRNFIKTLGGVSLTSLFDSCATVPVPPVSKKKRSSVSEPPALACAVAKSNMPEPPREFRAVWIATVNNIDWPSKPGLPVEQQKAELSAMLDRAAALNLNAVIFQVRPAADALYQSKYEPWSAYLTGKQGRAPEPFYDPLDFAVEEAHRRGLALHAWFNPYRVRRSAATSAPAATHISQTHPEIVRSYGKQLWLDPGEPAARDYSVRVILDVVSRYDIDGVHVDDYFYPYPITDSAGHKIAFPDNTSWAHAKKAGVTGSRADWRRRNIDQFIQNVYQGIKHKKSWVKFGISPFAIWRSGHPGQIRGFSSYDQLYADTRKWLHNGWLDYLSPELYWPIATTLTSYPILLRWWVEQNSRGRHIWPGNFTNKVDTKSADGWPVSEIIGQIYVTRGQPGATGNVHFSMKSLMNDPDDLVEQLTQGPYPRPALVPASPWMDCVRPARPSVTLAAFQKAVGGLALTMAPGDEETVRKWVIRVWDGIQWTIHLVPGGQRSYLLKHVTSPELLKTVTVSAVDRVGNEGPLAKVNVPVS